MSEPTYSLDLCETDGNISDEDGVNFVCPYLPPWRTAIFRRAITTRTWEPGEEPETQYWLEVKPDIWIGTRRLAENREESVAMQKQQGYGGLSEERTGNMAFVTTTRHLRQYGFDTLEILDPA